MNRAAAAEHLPADRGLPLGSLGAANPQHCPLLPRLPKAALGLFKDGDQTTGTCLWKKSDTLQSSMAKAPGFRLSDSQGQRLHWLGTFVSSKLQRLDPWELLWAQSLQGLRRRQTFLHRQQKKLLSQLSSCCTAFL